MVSSLTSLRGLTLPVVGGDAGTWGNELNSGVMSILDNILAATTTLYSSNATSVTLTEAQAQSQRINCVSSAAMTITLQNSSYGNGAYIFNTGSQPVTIQTTAAAGITLTLGQTAQSWIYSDGTNVSAAPDGPLFASDGSSQGAINTAAQPALQIVQISTGTNNLVTAFKNAAGSYTQEWAINSSGESVGRTDATYGLNNTGATVGTLGEVFTIINTSGTALTNNIVANLGTVTPSAGTYLVYGDVTITPAGGLCSLQDGGFGIGTNTFTGTSFSLAFSAAVMQGQRLAFPTAVVALTGSTAINLLAEAAVSAGSITGTGHLTCFRIR